MKLRGTQYWLALILTLSPAGLPLSAQSPQERATAAAAIPVEAFFSQANARMPRLSPDGTKIAYLKREDGRFGLAMFDRATETNEFIVPPQRAEPRDFFWKGNEHLVYYGHSSHRAAVTASRAGLLTSVPYFGGITRIDGTWRKRLGQRQLGQKVIDELHGDPERLIILDRTLQYSNLLTSGRSLIFDPIHLRSEYLFFNPVVDTDGQLRFVNRVNMRKGLSEFLYRGHNEAPWVLVVDEPANPLRPAVAIMWMTADQQSAYVVSRHEHDRGALYEFDLDEQWLGEMLFVPPEGEIAAILHSKGDGRLLGVHYVGIRDHIVWFDSEFDALQRSLDEQYPDADVRILDHSSDEKTMLVTVTSDKKPGTVNVLDRNENTELVEFKRKLPQLESQLMRPQEVVRYFADDGLEIVAYLTRPHQSETGDRVPLVVLTHRDYFVGRWHWGFNPIVQFLASRGYAVLQVNHRGSAGFGRGFVEMGRFQLGTGVLQDLIAGIEWTVGEGIVDPDRVAIMGGYLALAGISLEPDVFSCGVNVSGRADLEIAYRKLGEGSFKGKRDWDFRNMWIGQTREDRAEISPLVNVDNITVPSFHSYQKDDPDIRPEHATRLQRQLKKHDIPHEFHIVKPAKSPEDAEEDHVQLYRRIEAFLAKNL